jgi:mannose-1-phosphate guanylyltransferase
MKVKTFTEKPNSKLAKTFVESGDFVWNSGMFVWKLESLLHAFEAYMPDVAEVFEEGKVHFGQPSESEFIASAYTQVKNISIDYGVMEKSNDVYVILGDFGWSDIGSWQSLHELREKDAQNNVVEANALLFETENCFVKTDSDKLVVVQGLDNYLINESDNVLLICKLDAEHKFRDFVANAKKKGADFV